MKSRPDSPGQNILASQNNDRRDDARGGSFLMAHQQLGALALGTVPTNGQVVPIVINGTTITVTAVTSIGSTANNVLIGGSALAFVTNLVNFLRRPDLTTSTQVAASSANQTLLQYVGWAWPGASTNIVPFSLNKNVNGNSDVLTSFNITGITVTAGTWTAQTMQLYIEDGTYYVGTTRVLFTGGSTPTVTAPVSHPRIDVLSINSSGTLSWTTGTENVTPVAPTYPTGVIVICELYNVVGETALYDIENQQSGQGYIYNDIRPTLGGTYVSSKTQIANGLVIFDPGSEVQGNILYYNGANWVLLAPGTAGYNLATGGPSANPSWALSSMGHVVQDQSQPTQSSTTTGSFETLTSYNSVPAIVNGQTIWIRGMATLSLPTGSSTGTFQVSMNGTAMFNFAVASIGQLSQLYFDVMIMCPTASSAGYITGTWFNITAGTAGFIGGSATAANLSSAFTLLTQVKKTSGFTGTPTWTLNQLQLYVLN
jgi:hypothetical protein